MNAPRLFLPHLLTNRKAQARIAGGTLAAMILGGAYALLAPRWYRSTLSVVPTTGQRSGSISSLLGGDLGGLAAGLGAGSGGAADVAKIAAVLQSGSVTDAVIEKFDLRTRYDESYMETAREALWQHCEVKTLPKPGIVQLSCEDKDPRTVQALLAYFADIGNQVFRRVSVSSASEEVRFLDRRAAELRQQAETAAARMREFQEKHRIVDLESQARAVVSSLSVLRGQQITKQMELDYARTFSSRDEAATRQLESQLSVVDEKVGELESQGVPADPGRPPKIGKSGLFPGALAVPKLRAEYEQLYRDRRVAEALLVFALERLEGAKASEARDVSTFQVLDLPPVPTKKARPGGLKSVAIAFLVGLLASLGLEWRRAGWHAPTARPEVEPATTGTPSKGP